MPIIKLAFLDVGQGDTTIISCPDTQEAIVIDCVDALSVLDYLERERIKQLRGVIITHLHADHYAEVAELLYNCTKVVGTKGCEVLATTEEIIDPKDLNRPKRRKKKVENGSLPDPKAWLKDKDKHSEMYEIQPSSNNNLPLSPLATLHRWSQQNEEKCEEIKATKHSSLPFDGTLVKSLQLLYPPLVGYHKLKLSGLNNTSSVFRIAGTGSSALLTGDLEPEGWKLLQAKHPILASDVLKFPHHGGAWKEPEVDDLLSSIQPSVVVISVGSNNIYDHPRADVFTSLHKRDNLRLLCTQATEKCQQSVQNERETVIQQFQTEAMGANTLFISPKPRQCPCAGTVIIELGDKPRVLQPEANFHTSIINVHFHDHKCRIRSDASLITSTPEATSYSSDI